MLKACIKHLKTVSKHRKHVRRLCKACGIPKQGWLHDLSKYSPTEFWTSVKNYSGKFSPTENEIREKGYSEVWLHHKGCNKHHPEYWHDGAHGGPIEMPAKYVVEMFCDRVAACKVYQGDKYTIDSALNYFNDHPDELDYIHPDTCAAINQLLVLLSKWGEEHTCRFIKEEWLPLRQ